MMTGTIRRQRKNYLLPTEALPIFIQMVGVPITKFKTGTRCTSAEDIAKERAQYKAWGLPDEFHGQPYFLTFENSKTIVFYYDEFLGSIVLKEIAYDVDAGDFFDTLESQDQLGSRTQIRGAVDLPSQLNLSGKTIKAITIYKLPNNFYGKPTAYDLLNECVVCLDVSVAAAENALLVCEVASKKNPGKKVDNIRLDNWQNLDPGALAELTCIWSSSEAGGAKPDPIAQN